MKFVLMVALLCSGCVCLAEEDPIPVDVVSHGDETAIKFDPFKMPDHTGQFFLTGDKLFSVCEKASCVMFTYKDMVNVRHLLDDGLVVVKQADGESSWWVYFTAMTPLFVLLVSTVLTTLVLRRGADATRNQAVGYRESAHRCEHCGRG